MRVLLRKSMIIDSIIGEQEYDQNKVYIESPYIIRDDNLIYNTMTCELISDADVSINHKYLVEHWFYFSDDIDPYTFVKAMKKIYQQRIKPKKIDTIHKYTILTTTKCNARCPYCYEKNHRRIDMTEETAADIVEYIARTGGMHPHITWFGGEPLMNSDVITMISLGLEEKGVLFDSSMISNGYLFNEYDPAILVHDWKLKSVQITLDGTSENYNQIKNYIYGDDDEDPFSTVINSIHYLLDNSVFVKIRLNISKDNVSDVHELIDYLKEEFEDSRYFYIYSHNLFDDICQDTCIGCLEIQEHLQQTGKTKNYSLEPKIIKNCMANSMNSIVITPEGKLTLCEHFIDEEVVGDIYKGITNIDKVNEWQVESSNMEECKTCPLLPQCTKIKKCPIGECNELWKEDITYKIKKSMEYEVKRYESTTKRKLNSE